MPMPPNQKLYMIYFLGITGLCDLASSLVVINITLVEPVNLNSLVQIPSKARIFIHKKVFYFL